MLTNPGYLVDASAIVRLPDPTVAGALSPLILAGEATTCGVIEFELLGCITGRMARADVEAARAAAFHWLSTTDDDFRRAEVQRLLAEEDQHRVGWPLLVVAAVAERYNVCLLHCDAAFELIAKVTGQRAEWVGAEERRQP